MPLLPGTPASSSSSGTLDVFLSGTAGTLTVYLDPSTTLEGIQSTIGVRISETAGTMAVNIGKTDGTITIRTDPGYELGSIKGINSSIAAHILSTNGTMAVNVGKTDGTVTVRLDPGYTIGHIQSIKSTTEVYLGATAGTLRVKLDPESVISGIQSTIGVRISETAGTIRVLFNSEPTVIASGKHSTTTRPILVNTDGAIKVYDVSTGTIATVSTVTAVTSITNSIAVHVLSTGGTLAVKLDPSYNVVNTSNTLVVPIVTSGNFNGVSVLGKTIAGPTSGRVLKIFAIAITTTAQVGTVASLTNGAGTATEFWRYALQAPSQGIAGANLAVTPPGYLFATASGSTLALKLDNASLVHYSVSYFEESA